MFTHDFQTTETTGDSQITNTNALTFLIALTLPYNHGVQLSI